MNYNKFVISMYFVRLTSNEHKSRHNTYPRPHIETLKPIHHHNHRTYIFGVISIFFGDIGWMFVGCERKSDGGGCNIMPGVTNDKIFGYSSFFSPLDLTRFFIYKEIKEFEISSKGWLHLKRWGIFFGCVQL